MNLVTKIGLDYSDRRGPCGPQNVYREKRVDFCTIF